MLFSVLTGWLQKQSSVTLNFPNEKLTSPAMWLLVKILWPSVLVPTNIPAWTVDSAAVLTC